MTKGQQILEDYIKFPLYILLIQSKDTVNSKREKKAKHP